MKNEDMTLAVFSCDSYDDAWKPCVLSLKKWWPECPYATVLINESKEPEKGLLKLQLPENCAGLLKSLRAGRFRQGQLLPGPE